MAQELQPGTRLSGGSYGGYTIRRVLGRGGFGVTYMAESQVGIQFAIKEFFPKNTCERDEASNSIIVTDVEKIDLVARLRRRFIDEAMNVAGVEHPYIVHVVETFEENGTAYMVMENVEGVTLQTCVRNNGPMDEDTARDIIIKAALALHHMHNKRITHLDIKPDNIILTASGDPVIIDFGLSRQHTSNNTASGQQLTAISKGYTAHEQYSRQNVFLPQSDVYSLAATYYFLLTGKRPPEPTANYNYAADLPSGVTDASRAAIAYAMRYSPQKRTASMTTFIGHLRGMVLGPGGSSGTGSGNKHVKPEKSHSLWFWNAILLAVLVAAVIHFALYSDASSSSMRSDAFFKMNKDEFFGGLGSVTALSIIGLLLKGRGAKIFFALLALAGGAALMLNFNLS